MGNARKTVLRLLTRLENSGSYSNILLDEGLERSDLSPQDKKFAAGCSRDVIAQGAELLGWELDQLLDRTLAAMRAEEAAIEAAIEEAAAQG